VWDEYFLYPLFASSKVVAIDEISRVSEEPRVSCMVKEDRLHFFCPELVCADSKMQ
jgi:hypothetical protein